MKMETVTGISKLFIKMKEDGYLSMILAKITDDVLFAWTILDTNAFVADISASFKVSRSIVDAPIIFNGCQNSQEQHGDVLMDMYTYIVSITPLYVTRNLRKEARYNATDAKYSHYRSMAGSITWAGNGYLPQAAFAGYYMQQKEPRLRLHYLTEANRMVKEIKGLVPIIRSRKIRASMESMDVWMFSDASFNIA